MLNFAEAIASMPLETRKKSREIRRAPGELITLKGAPVTRLYILYEGQGRVSNEFFGGHRYSFAEVEAPDLIGEYEVLGEKSFYASTCEAITPCRLLCMTANVFRAWLLSDARIAYAVATKVAQKSWPTSNKIGHIKYLRAEEKLLGYLEQRTAGIQSPVRLASSRQDIADAIGASVKTVNRSIATLEARGFLSLLHGKIAVTLEQRDRIAQASLQFHKP